MPPKLPPPKPPVPPSRGTTFVRYIQAHKSLKPYADRIQYWAGQYGLDPTYFAALIFFESKGDPQAKAFVKGKQTGAGLGQINPQAHLGEYVPWLGRKLKPADLYNPEINLHWSAMYFRQQKDKYGGYDAAYREGYNHGYTGASPFKGLGVPSASGSAPQDTVTRGVETSVAKSQNPYLQGQNFLNAWHNTIDPIWESYTGRRATKGEAYAVIKSGVSTYHLEVQLSKQKSFIGSPVWETRAPGYTDVFQQIYGTNAKPPTQLIAYGIIHNLDGQGFAHIVRKRKDYVNSNEFKTNVAGFENIYRKVYGTPDQTGATTIQRAVINGWSQDQFARYLRAQPEYSRSQEWGSAVSGLLDTLGMITGQGVVMTPGAPRPNAGQASKPPPADNRVKGTPGLGVEGPQYHPGLNG